jgi:hypothetical protein
MHDPGLAEVPNGMVSSVAWACSELDTTYAVMPHLCAIIFVDSVLPTSSEATMADQVLIP